MLHKIGTSALRIAAAAAAVWCVTSGPSVLAQTTAPLIRIGASAADPNAALLYAGKAGVFKKYGLNVEVVKLGGSAAVAAALAGGSLELGASNPLSVVSAYGKGLPFTVVGNLTSYDPAHPDVALIVAADSTIKAPADLAGKTLGSNSLSDMNSIATNMWLSQHHVDTSMLKLVEIPPTTALAALEQGRIAAATVNEPFYSIDVQTGKVRILGYPYDAFGKRVSNDLIFANSAWADANHDAIERFMHAVQEASNYLGSHESESAALIAEFGGADPATLVGVRHPRREAAIDPAELQPVIDAAARFKLIPNDFPARDMLCSCALRGGQ